MCGPILLHYIQSASMLQKFLTAIVAEEWAYGYNAIASPSAPLLTEKFGISSGTQ
jgi:TATA-binding protein-associated factor